MYSSGVCVRTVWSWVVGSPMNTYSKVGVDRIDFGGRPVDSARVQQTGGTVMGSTRRRFTDEYRRHAVRLVLDSGDTVVSPSRCNHD